MTDATRALLPCPNPWCSRLTKPSVFQSTFNDKWSVECSDCDINSPFMPLREEAVRAWNYRPSDIAGTAEANAFERAAAIADKWAEENRSAAARARKSISEGSRSMAEMLDGAAIECNAIAQEVRALAALTPSPCPGDVGMRKALEIAADALNGCEYATSGDVARAGAALAVVRAALTPSALSGDAGEGETSGVAENKAGGLWYRRWFKAQARVNELEAMLANPAKHKFWGAGEADCPREIKASNGELHILRCKACGLDNPRDDLCRPESKP